MSNKQNDNQLLMEQLSAFRKKQAELKEKAQRSPKFETPIKEDTLAGGEAIEESSEEDFSPEDLDNALSAEEETEFEDDIENEETESDVIDDLDNDYEAPTLKQMPTPPKSAPVKKPAIAPANKVIAPKPIPKQPEITPEQLVEMNMIDLARDEGYFRLLLIQSLAAIKAELTQLNTFLRGGTENE